MSILNKISLFFSIKGLYDLTNNFIFTIGYDVAHPDKASDHERYKLRKEKGIDYLSLEPSVVGVCFFFKF